MKNKIILTCVLSIVFITSCKKFVEIPTPKNELITHAVFEDSVGAVSAITGIYVDMMQNFNPVLSNGGLTIFAGLSSDELFLTTTNSDQNSFYNNNISSKSTINQSQLWAYSYKLIYETNACMEGLSESTGISQSLKNRLQAECTFLRCFLYFNLINLYGDVPLIVSTDYHVNQKLPRASVPVIYNQIMTDLIASKNLLYQNTNRYRPNIYSASALLSKIYLYQKEWVKAESEADLVINSGRYSLERNLNDVFLVASKETIFALEPMIPNRETMEGFYFVPSSSSRRPSYSLTTFLMNAFEIADMRKTSWTKSNTVSGQQYFYPFKYKQWLHTTGTAFNENYTVFRLAELYIIRAEARAQQNNLMGAIEDINVIRNRAGLGALSTSLDRDQILKQIEQERRIEFFCEWGNRWFDLKRTAKADNVLGLVKINWKSSAALFPIPQYERDNNPNLTQNSGY